MRNIKMVIEYDGSHFSGFQKQRRKGIITVQEEMENLLSKILQEPIKVIPAARTDAGVHALGQVVNFKTTSSIECRKIKFALNGLLGSRIIVREAGETDERFHARFSAVSRRYQYLVLNRKEPSSLLKNFACHFHYSIDTDLMNEGARFLIGTHDFTSFQAGEPHHSTKMREMKKIMCWRVKSFSTEKNLPYIIGAASPEDFVIIEMEANSFLRGMIRKIAGTLLMAGEGRMEPSRMGEILHAKDFTLSGPLLPPCGLCLMEVNY